MRSPRLNQHPRILRFRVEAATHAGSSSEVTPSLLEGRLGGATDPPRPRMTRRTAPCSGYLSSNHIRQFVPEYRNPVAVRHTARRWRDEQHGASYTVGIAPKLHGLNVEEEFRGLLPIEGEDPGQESLDLLARSFRIRQAESIVASLPDWPSATCVRPMPCSRSSLYS